MDKKAKRGGRKMRKVAVLGILAIMLLASVSEASAHWKPVIGTVLNSPTPVFDGITEK